jgi:hypothetical protein
MGFDGILERCKVIYKLRGYLGIDYILEDRKVIYKRLQGDSNP